MAAGGKQAGEQRAHGAADAVNAEGVERVVVAEELFDAEDHEAADDAGDAADGESRHGLNEAGGLGDGGQSGDRAGDSAQGRGLAVLQPLGDDPGDGGGGGGELRIDEGAGGQRPRAQRAAGVEAEPAHPQHSRADEAEHHGVGRHILLRIADALAEIEGADQRGDAAGDVDDGAAGKVEDRPAGRGVGEFRMPPTPQIMCAMGQ